VNPMLFRKLELYLRISGFLISISVAFRSPAKAFIQNKLEMDTKFRSCTRKDATSLSLPPPITSDVPGTWAFDTMSRRIVADILPRIIEDNSDELTQPSSPLRSECLLQLRDLESSLLCGKNGYLRGLADKGPDLILWDKILASIPDDERNWLNAPWVVTEFYFYRRIVEAFKYFETGYDMFAKQKQAGLRDALPFVNDVAEHLISLLGATNIDVGIPLEMAVFTSLWGNKMDLSLWPSASLSSSGSGDNTDRISVGDNMSKIRSFILDDQTDDVVRLLRSFVQKKPLSTEQFEVGIVVDNAGYELVSDLVLAYCLLATQAADTVTLHTKAHPTFVSDAMNKDVLETIAELQNSSLEATAQLGKLLAEAVESGKIKLVEDLFWCQPTPFWSLPVTVAEKLSSSKLIFVKGDANYRRLLGDRHWPLTAPAREVLSYWDQPVCALRTFKAELGCGVSEVDQQRALEMDSKWMVSGKWGVVQLAGV